LAAWGDLGQKDKNGCGLPHWAAYKGDVDSLRLLHLWAGQDMRGADKQGMTPLHRAASVGAEAACKFLITQCYVDPAAINHDGETAADVCRKVGRVKLAAFMESCYDKNHLTINVEDGGRSVLEVQRQVDDKVQMEKLALWTLPGVYAMTMLFCLIIYLTELTKGCIVFAISAPLSVAIFAYLTQCDSGRRMKRKVGETAIEELQSQLERIATNSLPEDEDRDHINQICLTCMDWKGPRSKHCTVCDACVDNFDHHCGWLNNCVAKKNHRLFVLMLYVTAIGQLAHFYACYCSLEGEGFVYPVLQAFTTRTLMFLCIVFHLFLTPFIGLLAIFHSRIIALNLNTNESHNLHKYSHFWRKRSADEAPLEGTPLENHGALEFVNPFDEGVWRNCYNFWSGKDASGVRAISKVKYLELNPMGKCNH
jgi:hypothetical protein